MKLTHSERRRARELVGLDPMDCCPVVIVDGPQQPRLVGFEGHYIDSVGVRIMTVEGMQRAGPSGRQYVVASRHIEVGHCWMLAYRRSVTIYNKEINR